MFQFEIHGMPKAQQQTRFVARAGRPICYDPSKKDKEIIQWQIKHFAPEKPFDSAVEMWLLFFLPIPKAVSKLVREQMINRVILPDKKPDDDNLSYLVTNALKGIVYDDDKRVCVRHVYKFYGTEPKTVIRVRPILQAQQLGYREMDEVQ